MLKFNQSLPFDKRLCSADLQGSIAYSTALKSANLITKEEAQQLAEGLTQINQEWLSNTFVINPETDEDIHTANERRLGELVGKVAGKLHTGRSRNDQVATDMRIWLRGEGKVMLHYLLDLIKVITERAAVEIDVLMPGYTHLQRAQPIRWSHFLLSHAWALKSDADRLAQILPRVNQLPLGSGALAGNPFNIDQPQLAKDLSFEGIMPNSLYAVSDRDFVVEFMFWGSLVMTHLSKLAEDFILYSSAEFGFVNLHDAYSTGSSLMPQKKNPDSLELIRGKSGRVFGNIAGFMMTLKGLPSTYNKDLQEDKEPLFDTIDTVSACLQITTGLISTLTINANKMKNALTMDMLATDLAEYLVRKGIPFRETHHISGAAVRLAETKGCSLAELGLDDLKGLSAVFEKDVEMVFDFEGSVERRGGVGGTLREGVEGQLVGLREFVKKDFGFLF